MQSYGYKYDEIDKKRWSIDEETADVVRHIFNLRKQGESVNGIAKILKKEKIYIPSVYAIKKGFKKPLKAPSLGEYLWTHVMVRSIISNQSYVGDVINFKTYSKLFRKLLKLPNVKNQDKLKKVYLPDF